MFETLQSVKTEITKKKTEDLPYFLDRLKNNQKIESKLSKIEQDSIELELKKPIFEKLKQTYLDRFTEDFYRNWSRQYLHSYAIQKKNPSEIIEREYLWKKIKTKGLDIVWGIKKESFALYKSESLIKSLEQKLNSEWFNTDEEWNVYKIIELYNEIRKLDLSTNEIDLKSKCTIKRRYVDIFCGFYDWYKAIPESVYDSDFDDNAELTSIKQNIFWWKRNLLEDIPTKFLIVFLTQKHKEVTQLTWWPREWSLTDEQKKAQVQYFTLIHTQIKQRIISDPFLNQEDKNKMLSDLIQISSWRKAIRTETRISWKESSIKTEYINAHEDMRNVWMKDDWTNTDNFAWETAQEHLYKPWWVVEKILEEDKLLVDDEFKTTPKIIYNTIPELIEWECTDDNGNPIKVWVSDPWQKPYSELWFRDKISYSILNKFILLCGDDWIKNFKKLRKKIIEKQELNPTEQEQFSNLQETFCQATQAKATFFEPYLKKLFLLDSNRYFKKWVTATDFPQITNPTDKKVLNDYLSIMWSGREMSDSNAKTAIMRSKVILNIWVTVAAAFIPWWQWVFLSGVANTLRCWRIAAFIVRNGKLIQSWIQAGVAWTASRILIDRKGYGSVWSAIADIWTWFIIDSSSGMFWKFIWAKYWRVLINKWWWFKTMFSASNLKAIWRNTTLAGWDFIAWWWMESFRQNILLWKEFSMMDIFKSPAPWLALFFTLAGMKWNSLTQVEYDNLVLKCRQIEAFAAKDPKIGQMEIEIETEFGKKKIKVEEIIKWFPKDWKRMTVIEGQTAKSTNENVDLKWKIDKTSKKMKKEVYKATNKHITEEIRVDEAEKQMKELWLIKENLSEKQIALIAKTHELTKESMAKIREIIWIPGSEPPRIKNRKNITENDRQEIEKVLNENDSSSWTMPIWWCYDDNIERRTKIFVLENVSEWWFNNKQAWYLVDHHLVWFWSIIKKWFRWTLMPFIFIKKALGKKPSISWENPTISSTTTTTSSITKINYDNLDHWDINAINTTISNLYHATIPDIDVSVQAYKNWRISYGDLIQIIKNHEIELNNIDNWLNFIKSGRSQAHSSWKNKTTDQQNIINTVNSFFTYNGNKFDQIDLVKDKLNKAKNLIEHTKTIDTIKGKIWVKMDNVLYLLWIHKDQKNTLNNIENLIAHNKSFNKRQNILEIYTDLRFLKFLLEKNASSIWLKADEVWSTLSRVKELITIMEKLKWGKDIYDIEWWVLVKKSITDQEGFMNNYLWERYDAMYIFWTLQDKYTAWWGVAETFGKMLRKEIKSTKRRWDHVNFDEIEKKTEKAMESERGTTNTANSWNPWWRDDLTIDILTTAALPDKYSIPIKLLQSLLKGDKVGTTWNAKKYANLIRNDERLQNKFYVWWGVYDFFSHLIQWRPLHAVYCLAENYLIWNMAFGNTTSARWMRRIAMWADILWMSWTKAVVWYLLSLGWWAIEEFLIEGMPFMISNFTLGINKYFDDKTFENKTYWEYFLEILDKSQNDDQYKVFNAELEKIKDNVLSGKKENSEIDIKNLEALKMKIVKKENSEIKKLEILAICGQLNEQFTLKEWWEVYNFWNRIKKYINSNNIDLSTINSDISYIKQFFWKKLRESEFKSFVRIPPDRLIEIIGISNIQSLANIEIKNKIKGDEDITKNEIIKIMPWIEPYTWSMEDIRREYKKEVQEKIEKELKDIDNWVSVSSNKTTIIKTINGCPENIMSELLAKQKKYPEDDRVTSSNGKWILKSGSKTPERNQE